MNEENRKSRRYPFNAIASIKAMQGGSLVSATTLINNISYTGAGLTSYTPIKEGTHVSLKMIKVKGRDSNERLEGTIAWAYKHDKFYHIGIAFDEELHPDRQPKLYEQFFRTIKFN
ncbi:MAG: PilZ domain-containing protein [Candidatus Thorarchaeota archaeon]